MKNIHIILLLLAIAMISSCNRKTSRTTTKSVKSGETEMTMAPDSLNHGAIVINLEKKPCRGNCPWFKAVFYEDGTIFYDGRKHVPHLGNYKLIAGASVAQSLVKQAEKIDFFNLAKAYPTDKKNVIADFPIINLSVNSGTQSHSIKLQNEIPQDLLQFVDAIDAAINKQHFPSKAKEQILTEDKKDKATLLMRIERKPCYGKCPWYTADFYDDGTILYEGKKFVKHMGKFTIHSKPETVRALTKKAKRFGFMKLSSNYPTNPNNKITDLPITVLMVKSGRTAKTITMQNEIPEVLVKFIKDIEGTLARMNYPE